MLGGIKVHGKLKKRMGLPWTEARRDKLENRRRKTWAAGVCSEPKWDL